MSIALDEFDYDYERSRAAIAVACLQWLRCTGPAIDHEVGRGAPPEVPRDSPPDERPMPVEEFTPHPLWDRWLDV
jgi:hypothetical protein